MDGLLIGRFQPFHLGHLEALTFALSKVDRLWVGLGSSNSPRDKTNPFSINEREQMILGSINDIIRAKIDLFPIPDVGNHQKWIEQIDSTVPHFDVVFTNDDLTRHLYSRRRVKVVPIPFVDRGNLSGTRIRDLITTNQKWEHLVPAGTKDLLLAASAKDRLADL